jgi:Arc/MetJ-type ribon-helix-helix transcriptional regulator
MKTVSLSLRLPKKRLEEIDSLVEAGFYKSRNEAMRDAVRRLIKSKRVSLALSLKGEPFNPDKVMKELRKIRGELWQKEKRHFRIEK